MNMTIDERIDEKLREWRAVRSKIEKLEIIHEVKSEQPIVYSSTQDILNYSILADQEQILLLEHQLLLNKKDPATMKLDTSVINSKINSLRKEIRNTELLIKS
jgi:hypothetical protein